MGPRSSRCCCLLARRSAFGPQGITLNTRVASDTAALQKAAAMIRNFKQDWAGRVVDDQGLVHIANETGSNPPLIWCFNASPECERLATALGPDQPLVGLRSGHMVARTDYRSTRLDFALADLFHAAIRKHFPAERFFIGGNCQGATIAGRLKEAFALENIPVLGAFHMESIDLQPFAGDQVMIFGEQSERFNPFLKGEEPYPVWNSIYRSVKYRPLPGGHGTYFRPETVGNLGDIIADTIRGTETGAQTQSSLDLVVDFGGAEGPVAEGEISVNVRISSSQAEALEPAGDLKLYAFWYCLDRLDASHQLVDVDRSMYAQAKPLQLRAPDPGRWNLALYPVKSGQGPINIAAARARSVDLVI